MSHRFKINSSGVNSALPVLSLKYEGQGGFSQILLKSLTIFTDRDVKPELEVKVTPTDTHTHTHTQGCTHKQQ